MTLKGEQIFVGTEPIPVIGDMLLSGEFYVVGRELEPEYSNALMMYAPQNKGTLKYVHLTQAVADLEELRKQPSLANANLGIYKMRIRVEKVL